MNGMILIFEIRLTAVDGAPIPRGGLIIENFHQCDLFEQDMLKYSE